MLIRDAEPGEILMIQRKGILERTIVQLDVSCGEDSITNVTGMSNGPKVFDPGGRHIEENYKLIPHAQTMNCSISVQDTHPCGVKRRLGRQN